MRDGTTNTLFTRTNYNQIGVSGGTSQSRQDGETGLQSDRDPRANLLSVGEGIWREEYLPGQAAKKPEKENMHLKKLVADLSLDNAILKEVLSKNDLARKEKKSHQAGSRSFRSLRTKSLSGNRAT
jgi:hypothetical protein